MSHPPFVLELAQASIVTPVDGSANSCAEQIAHTLQAQYDLSLPVVCGNQPIKTRHAIALGCLANNPFIEQLYLRWQTLVDRWYPGSGGYVVQTIARAPSIEGCALLLGGSDAQGVAAATAEFLPILSASANGELPWLLKVRLATGHKPLPEDRLDALGTSTSLVPTPESALPEHLYQSGFTGGSPRQYLLRLGMYGPHADNVHFSRSSQLGLRYLYTGSLEDAQVYRRALLGEVESGVLHKLYHYKSIRMFQLWELLAPCPVFSPVERKIITAALLEYLQKESGLAHAERIDQMANAPGVFDRHTACEALNLWIGADFFYRESGDKTWLQRQKIAERFFAGQAGTDVPITGLTEGYASYLEVYLEWMLWSRPEQIRTDQHVRLWAQRVLGLCTNAGLLVAGPQTGAERYPYHLLRKLAFLLDDGSYLYAAERRERQVPLGNDRLMQFSAGQAYAGDVESRRPNEEAGLTVFPANERLRQWKAASISAERSFDRAVGREGWQVDDDYWMVIGMRSGGKCMPNVGCLAAYERFGAGLITSEANQLYPSSASPWRHSAITVSAEGLAGGMAEGAELTLHQSAHGGELLAYEVRMDPLYRWVRSLLWMPAKYLLVVDHIEVMTSGEYTIGLNWRCGMEMESAGQIAQGTFVTDAGTAGTFWVETAPELDFITEENSYPALGAPPAAPPTREHLLHALVDRRRETLEVATLLHATLETAVPVYRLAKYGETWTVEGDGEIRAFQRTDAGDLEVNFRQTSAKPINRPAVARPALEALHNRWHYALPSPPTVWQCDGANLVIGTQGGEIIAVDSEGETAWTARGDTAITALAQLDDEVIAGTAAGEVLRFDAQGRQRWRHRCAFRPERTFWPWWFLETPMVGSLAAGRDPHSGREIVAAGTGSTSVNFIDGETGALQADRLSEYGLPDQIKAHLDPQKERLFFFVGHSWLSCGSTVWAWAADELDQPQHRYCESVDPMGRLTGGWDTCAARDFWLGRWITAENEQLLVLRHGAVNQLTAYDLESAQPLWDVGLGGAPIAMAIVVAETAADARVHVADEYGWWTSFDGGGKKVGAQRIAQRLVGIHAETTGEIFLWNREQLLRGTAEQIDRRYALEARPLGWCQWGEQRGLLGTDDSNIVLQKS
ncbi:MAG: hypothetical protein ACI906_003485 [Candidatus Latescibacterota bacterium]|jgi:hypothetical protein